MSAVKDHQPISDDDKLGAEAVRNKLELLLIERTHLQDRWRENISALKDAVAAGRLFGIEIELPVDTLSSPHRPQAPAEKPVQQSLFESAGELSIREVVLDQLKKAGIKGVKAGPLRQVIEKLVGHKIHEKTVGMTLYRLSVKGFARRDGITWYYVLQGVK